MNGQTIPASTPRHSQDWNEFCELHAITTAKELAKKYLLFATENPHHDLWAAENFSVQFAELFQQYFCHEVKEDFAMNPVRVLPFSRVQDYWETSKRRLGASSETEADLTVCSEADQAADTDHWGLHKSWSSEELMGVASPLATRRHFFIHLRRSWSKIFHRRSSEAIPGEGEGEALETAFKPGLAKKILLWTLSQDQAHQVCKEGFLKYGMVDDATMDSGTHWQWCRLVLRKAGMSDSEDYILELFEPLKFSRPKLLTTCSAVREIRRCTRLEMPDNMNTFVLKVNNCTNVVFEARDEQQLSSWTAAIKECLAQGDSKGFSSASCGCLCGRLSYPAREPELPLSNLWLLQLVLHLIQQVLQAAAQALQGPNPQLLWETLLGSLWAQLMKLAPTCPPLHTVHRRLWRLDTSANWWDRIIMEWLGDQQWLQNFRMRKDMFLELCEWLTPALR